MLSKSCNLPLEGLHAKHTRFDGFPPVHWFAAASPLQQLVEVVHPPPGLVLSAMQAGVGLPVGLLEGAFEGLPVGLDVCGVVGLDVGDAESCRIDFKR